MPFKAECWFKGTVTTITLGLSVHNLLVSKSFSVFEVFLCFWSLSTCLNPFSVFEVFISFFEIFPCFWSLYQFSKSVSVFEIFTNFRRSLFLKLLLVFEVFIYFWSLYQFFKLNILIKYSIKGLLYDFGKKCKIFIFLFF